ncbi:hypothetical protein H9P43_002189 [Blastocladiella emersonii ATCC 22665]|nr:hypothetical protein H9P43_002189 [Blastocladiella emersonii ATCC 22665]
MSLAAVPDGDVAMDSLGGQFTTLALDDDRADVPAEGVDGDALDALPRQRQPTAAAAEDGLATGFSAGTSQHQPPPPAVPPKRSPSPSAPRSLAPTAADNNASAAPSPRPSTSTSVHGAAAAASPDDASLPPVATKADSRLQAWLFRSRGPSAPFPTNPKASPSSASKPPALQQVLSRTRPPTLPPKDPKEDRKHLAQHAKMMQLAQARLAERGARAAKQRAKREADAIAALQFWTTTVLPKWDAVRYQPKTAAAWFKGVPPRLRGIVWSRAIGNALHITPDVYALCGQRAQDALTSRRLKQQMIELEEKQLREQRSLADVGAGAGPPVAAFDLADDSLLSSTSTLSTASSSSDGSPGPSSSPPSPSRRPATAPAAARPRRGPDMVLVGREDTLEVIAVDISRTFPQIGMFQSPGGPLSGPLSDVLEAFAVYRADMGYVQGMSYLAGMLLLNTDDYTAFATLCNMFRHRNGVLATFYRLDMPMVKAYFGVFEYLLGLACPDLKAHLDEVGVRPEFYLYEWLLSMFAKPLPLDTAHRVWDLWFLWGDLALFRVAVALLKFFETRLGGLPFEECLQDVLRLPGRLRADYDEDAFWAVVEVFHLDRDVYRAACRAQGLVPPE